MVGAMTPEGRGRRGRFEGAARSAGDPREHDGRQPNPRARRSGRWSRRNTMAFSVASRSGLATSGASAEPFEVVGFQLGGAVQAVHRRAPRRRRTRSRRPRSPAPPPGTPASSSTSPRRCSGDEHPDAGATDGTRVQWCQGSAPPTSGPSCAGGSSTPPGQYGGRGTQYSPARRRSYRLRMSMGLVHGAEPLVVEPRCRPSSVVAGPPCRPGHAFARRRAVEQRTVNRGRPHSRDRPPRCARREQDRFERAPAKRGRTRPPTARSCSPQPDGVLLVRTASCATSKNSRAAVPDAAAERVDVAALTAASVACAPAGSRRIRTHRPPRIVHVVDRIEEEEVLHVGVHRQGGRREPHGSVGGRREVATGLGARCPQQQPFVGEATSEVQDRRLDLGTIGVVAHGQVPGDGPDVVTGRKQLQRLGADQVEAVVAPRRQVHGDGLVGERLEHDVRPLWAKCTGRPDLLAVSRHAPDLLALAGTPRTQRGNSRHPGSTRWPTVPPRVPQSSARRPDAGRGAP